MEFHPIDFQISTRMRAAKDGTYTCEVEGLPVEGDQKIVRICFYEWRWVHAGER